MLFSSQRKIFFFNINQTKRLKNRQNFLLFNHYNWCIAIVAKAKEYIRRNIEVNPGPKRNYKEKNFIYHWNLNSSPEHSYAKLLPFEKMHILDIICLSVADLDPCVTFDGKDVELPSYNLIRFDHLSRTT